MTSQNKIYIGLGVLALGIITYYAIKPPSVVTTTDENGVITILPARTLKRMDEFPLKKGSIGGRVLDLQKSINKKLNFVGGYKPLKLDGIWGSKTDAAVKLSYGGNVTITGKMFNELVLANK